ncbi:PRC-barrel domain-containing protein [Pararhodobacter sp. SW119]|uniref:PRC-barrel domain-containing protein n=1 Tax=Pararhodobacter sp. SW119 TaxID=2780075 RepID=UPI001AE0C9F3|nr:PRC-barrel domain-containing protein [Pararhodobacter sp. SW119]
MRRLMFTTALVSMSAFGAVAQTSGEGDRAAAPAQSGQMVPAFNASGFIGKDLYTLDSDTVRELPDVAPVRDVRLRWTSDEAFLAERDSWENIGSIDEVILTQDGRIRGVLVDVGGFLGFMARTVMVDMDELYFVAEEAQPEDIGDFLVVATMTREELEALPEWDESTLDLGFEWSEILPDMPEIGTDTTDATADTGGEAMIGSPRGPAEPPAGYVLQDTPPTASSVIGADVYDAHGESIGQVDDVLIGDDNTITHLVLDIGGFLGVDDHVVALEVQNLDIYHSADTDSVRVHTPATEEQLTTLPAYEG